MALNCLQIIQSACRRIGITSPNAAITSTDPQILQLLELSNEEGVDQAAYPWEALQTETTFTTVATQSQGSMSTLAPGFNAVINDTMWNRTTRLPVYVSRSVQDWQQLQAMTLTGPYSLYRIRGDVLYFYPIPSAGHTIAFEYITTNWVNKLSGGTSRTWTSDSDTSFLDSELLVLGLVWRWKAAKGLDYAQDYDKYNTNLADAQNRDGSKPVLSTSGSPETIAPVVIVPSGSWGA